MAASTASPSSLASTCWVFPTRGKCAAWSSYWPSPPVLIVVLVAQISVHRFSSNLRFCAQLCTQLLNVPVFVVPPFPSTLSHYAQLRRPHKARRLVRFTVLRRIDRLEHSPSAARHLQIWSLRLVYTQLALRLPLLDAVLNRSETKFVGRVLSGRADAAVHALSLRRSISCRL